MPAPVLDVRTKGAKKALCIAVHYYNLPGFTLTNVHNDTRLVQRVLIGMHNIRCIFAALTPSVPDHFGFLDEDITILMDRDEPNCIQPTRDNIVGVTPFLRISCMGS